MKKEWLVDGKFTELSEEKQKGLSDEENAEYIAALIKNNRETINALNKKIEEGDKTEETLKEFKEAQGGMLKILESHGEVISELKMGGNADVPESVQAQVRKFISDNHDEIKSLYKNKNGAIEFVIKAPEDLTTGSATNPDGIPELVGTQVAPPSNVNLRGTIVDGLTTSISTSLAAYPYTETTPKDGDFSFVAEGGTKPQIDFKIETRYAEPKKIAAHEVLTEESVTDIVGLQSIATDYLRKKHDIKRENGILFGDGTGENPEGATTVGRLFVPGSMAAAVDSPNFMDVVNAAITDVYVTHNYQDETPYMPNLVMVNPVDFYIELVSAKNADGLPLYPNAGLFNRVVIGGVTIIPFEDIPVGQIFVADMSKYNVTNYVSYTVRIGWINDQFITNKFTMVGESRFHAFVKELDKQAFIFDSIATIKAAILKP